MNKLNTIFILFFVISSSVKGQSQVNKLSSPNFTLEYVGSTVFVQYRLSKNNSREKVNVILYRGNEKNEGLKAIHQLNNLLVSTDYLYIDSTLPGRGIYQYTIEIISNGVTVVRESATVYAYPITVAPFIKSFDANTRKGTNEVSISWNVANTFLVRNIILLRSRQRDGVFKPIGTLKKDEKSFLDKVDETNETFFYKIQIANASTGELVYTPVIQVIADFVIKPMPPLNVRGIIKNEKPQIFWQSADTVSRGFYVFKKLSTDEKFFQASNIIFWDPKNQMSWTDSGSQIKPGTTYQYKVIAESNSNTKSASSDTITISTGNDKILLTPPYDLRLLQNGDSVDIIWAPDEVRSDYITEYVVYQKKISERDFKIIGSANANAKRNYITIAMPESGSSFKVKSKSGDKESVPTEPVIWIDKTEKSFGPRFIQAEIIENILNITWLNMEDKNIREYRLYKWQGRDFKVIETIDKNTNTIQVKNYIAGEKNQYMLTALNTKGVENKGTKPITVY